MNDDAPALVEDLVRTIRASELLFTQDDDPYVAATIDAAVANALAGEVVQGAPPPVGKRLDWLREVHYAAHDAAVRRLWQQHRIVYDIDPSLWTELADIDLDTVIPQGLMTQLPHPDPFIALPEPILVPIDHRHRSRLVGFFVTGTATFTEGMYLPVSTSADSSRGDLMVLFAALVEDHQGRPYMLPGGYQDVVWSRITLRFGSLKMSIADAIDEVMARFDAIPEAGDVNQALPLMVTSAVAALVYLCATNAELTPQPAAAARRAAARRGSRKPPAVIQVGYRTGAALRAWRRSGGGYGPGGGGSVRPHIRRAHPHTYRVGPGRKETVIKFLLPIAVNANGDAEQTTVIPVR